VEALLTDGGPLGLLILFLLLGLVTGIPAGMFGIGGGLVLVPVLVWLFALMGFDSQYLVQAAIGTSLGAIIPTAMLSARGHYLRGGVHGPSVRRLLPAILVGAALGAGLAIQIDGRSAVTHLRRLRDRDRAVATAERPSAETTGGRARGLVRGRHRHRRDLGADRNRGRHAHHAVPLEPGTRHPPRHRLGGGARHPDRDCGQPGLCAARAADPRLDTPEWSVGHLYLPAIAGIALGAAVSVRAGVWLTHHLPVLMLRRAFAIVLMVAGVYMLLR